MIKPARRLIHFSRSSTMPAFNALRYCSTEFSPCDLCGHTFFVIVSDRDRLDRPLRTVICQSCGLVSTNPRPKDEDLDHFYREEYRKSYKNAFRPKLKHVYRAGMVALERLSYLLPMLQRGESVLDMGCGGGEMLFMMRGLGFSVQGIEPNTGYGTAARDILGLPVQLTTCQEAYVEPESLDVVTCFHVLEHMGHPVAALSLMAGWVKPGGLLMVEVPNVMSRCQWPQSRYHIGHLHHFSSSTLTLAGQKAGLRPVDMFTSADGGNLMVLFRRGQPGGSTAGSTAIPGHAQRVLAHLRTHTAFSHLMSHHPYVRPMTKLANRCLEQFDLLRFKDARVMLDYLLEEARKLDNNLRETKRRHGFHSEAEVALQPMQT